MNFNPGLSYKVQGRGGAESAHGNTGSFVATNKAALSRTIQNHIEPYKTIQNNLCITIQNHIEPYRTIKNLTAPYRL